MADVTPKGQMAAYLFLKGWTRRRKRKGEPWFYVDPTGCEVVGMRVEEAYRFQMKRERGLTAHTRGK